MQSPVQARPIRLGSRLSIWPPLRLAPMAGMTNHADRKICMDFGAGLCTAEMVSACRILGGGWSAWEVVYFVSEERPRSVQIFGSDPAVMVEATRRIADRLQVDHVDIDFGCPMPKVLQQGAAPALEGPKYRRILREAVRAAGRIPASVKLRFGVDEERFTFREAARVAEEEGRSMVALHARTVAQMYSGHSRSEFVAQLKSPVRVPLIGNGEIRTADDCSIPKLRGPLNASVHGVAPRECEGPARAVQGLSAPPGAKPSAAERRAVTC